MSYLLKFEGFILELNLEIFEEDINLPVNGSMSVSIKNNIFSAIADMDIGIKEFVKFTMDLDNLYKNLYGKAVIKEVYGNMYISFEGDGKGHIAISGYLCNRYCDNDYDIRFNNVIDQTALKDFCKELKNDCVKYFDML